MATEGNDTIEGTAGNDLIDGLGGDDIITGGLGRDTIRGGTGNDRFVIRGQGDLVAGESYAGGDGTDTMLVRRTGVVLSAVTIGADVENLICRSPDSSERYSVAMTARQLGAFKQIDSPQIFVTQAGLADLRGDWLATNNIVLQAADVTLILSENVYAMNVTGSEGRDKVTGTDQDGERLEGNGGDDVLAGGGGDDSIDGGAGADILSGGAGDDLFGTAREDLVGGDRIAGGDGIDTLFISGADFADPVLLEGSVVLGSVERLSASTPVGVGAAMLGRFDYISGDAIHVVTAGLADLRGTELHFTAFRLAAEGITFTMAGSTMLGEVDGSEWRDAITGGENADRISGHAGDDVIRGGGGSDTLSGGIGADLIQGGGGDDILSVGRRSELTEGDRLSGGAGWDTLHVADGTRLGNAFISGDIERLRGNDLTLTAREAGAFQEIDSAHVTITTRGIVDFSGTEVCPRSITLAVGGVTLTLAPQGSLWISVQGSKGADVIRVHAGAAIHANGGDDYLELIDGPGQAFGGSGNDTYRVGSLSGADIVEKAGGGIDTILASRHQVTLIDHVENLTFTGSADFDGFGNAAGNRIEGGSGRDELVGLGGDDALHGGLGLDFLEGGAGADRFVFDTAPGTVSNFDRIMDFAANDLIALDRAIFGALPGRGAALAGDAFVLGVRAEDAEDRIVYDRATGNLYYDADGNGAGARILFAQLDAGKALGAADFQLFG
jgi:Ca2+-binding RTX toxin-like protein